MLTEVQGNSSLKIRPGQGRFNKRAGAPSSALAGEADRPLLFVKAPICKDRWGILQLLSALQLTGEANSFTLLKIEQDPRWA